MTEGTDVYRVCKKCGATKPLSEFPRHYGHPTSRRHKCKKCFYKDRHQYEVSRGQQHMDALKQYRKQYREKNKEELLSKHRDYYKKNRERLLDQKREYTNKKEVKKHRVEYEKEYWRKRRIEDPVVDMRIRCRNRLHSFMQHHGYKKVCKTKEMIGCEWSELCEHLLATWQQNYGTKWDGEDYHIDHIIPLATANTSDDVIKLFHYTNLQMLKPIHNLDKKDKIDYTIN